MKSRRKVEDIQERVNLYLDNELSSDAKNKLLDEANSDEGVQHMIETERSFRDLIRNKVQRGQVPPDLIRSIRSKIKI